MCWLTSCARRYSKVTSTKVPTCPTSATSERNPACRAHLCGRLEDKSSLVRKEALRLLEGEGLITTRLGRNGGSAVVRPSSATIERSVGIFIRGQRIRFEAVLEARAAIEPPSARFAAMHRSDADLQEIRKSHAKLEQASAAGDVEAYVRANLDWHVQVVRASHNELLIAFISAMSQSVYAATDLEGFNSVEVRHSVIRVHQRVIEAIEARDGDAAARRMGRHVAAYISDVQKTQQTRDGVTPKES